MRKLFSAPRLFLLVAVAILSGIIVYVFYVTLLPLLAQEQWWAFLSVLLGTPLIFVGTACLAYGIWRLVQAIEQGSAPKQEDAPNGFSIIMPGGLWLLGGLALILLGRTLGA